MVEISEEIKNQIKEEVIEELTRQGLQRDALEIVEKTKKETRRRKLIKKRATELLALYSTMSPELIKSYKHLIEHLAFIDVMLLEFQEDILVEGFQVKYKNGKNQWGWKKNDSIDLFKKWYSERLSDSERLKRVLGLENSTLDDAFDDFLNRRE